MNNIFPEVSHRHQNQMFFKKLSRGISPEPTTEPKSFISPEPKEDEDFFCGNVGCQNAKERPRLKMMRSEKKFIWFDDAVNDDS